MSQSEINSESTQQHLWTLDSSLDNALLLDTSSNTDPSFLREKILANDKRKRMRVYCISGFFIFSIMLIIFLAITLKSHFINDITLVDNIELLSSNEGVDFYNDDLAFYSWLETSSKETIARRDIKK